MKGALRRAVLEALEPRQLLAANVTTWHGDPSRDGVNAQETTLTPQNVNANTFGKLFTYPVDGQVYAQPLYLSGVTMPGKGTHDLVLVATEHDSVYAFDGDSNAGANAAPLWQDSFIDPAHGVTTVPYQQLGSTDITPEIGITGTPVIDPATGTLYVVAKTREVDPVTAAVSYVQRLHALDVTSGAEKFGGPVTIGANTPGSGAGHTSVNLVPFNAKLQNQRAGLALYNGVVYITWASHGDQGPYHGWVIGYNAATLQQTSALDIDPNGTEAGIWMGAAAPAIDAAGNLYVLTGNGTFDAATGGPDYGESFLKINTQTGGVNGQLSITSYFTPYNYSTLNAGDKDLGSGGIVLLPDQSGTTHVHEAVFGGKEGVIYLADRDAPGGLNAGNNSQLPQTLPAGTVGSIFSTPALFNNTLYYTAFGGKATALVVANGQIGTTPSSKGSYQFSFTGSSPTISANGTSNGILWTVDRGGGGMLLAYDASNLGHLLYTSSQTGQRDVPGALPQKFEVTTVANGHVFIGAGNSLVVYGLLPQASTPPAAATALSAAPDPINAASQIDLTWTDNATNALEYKILRSGDGGATYKQIDIVGAGVTSYADVNLPPGTTYLYQVVASNSAGDAAPTNVASATTGGVPALPNIVGWWKLDDGSGTAPLDSSGYNDTGTISGEVTWTAGDVGPGALSFHGTGVADSHMAVPDAPRLRFAANQSFTMSAWVNPARLPGKLVGVVTKSSDVAPGYGIYIDANNNWMFGGQSVNIHGPAVTLAWHLLTVVQDGTAGTRTLYVDGVAVGTGAAEDAGGTGDLWIGGAKAFTSPTNAAYFPGAIDDVRIYNAALSPAAIATLATQFNPSAPTGVAVTVNGPNQVTVNWTDTATNAAGYLVEWSTDGVHFTPLPVLNQPNATQYVDTTVADGTTYLYRVSAFNSSGSSPTSPAAAAVTTPLGAPTQLAVTAATPSSVTLAWVDNADHESGYVVDRSPDATFATVSSVNLGPNIITYTDAGLIDGTAYFYRVRAVSSIAQSANATAVQAVTSLAAPSGLGSTLVTTTEVDLSWAGHSTSQTGFVVEESTNNGQSFTPIFTTAPSATACAVTGLAAGTTYAFRVKAIDAVTQSAYSNTYTVTSAGGPTQGNWTDGDVGSIGLAGSLAVGAGGTLTVSGAGRDIYNAPDAFNFAYQQVSGDATIVARLVSQSASDPYAKAGIMFRTSLDPASPMVDLVLQRSGLLIHSRRVTYLGGKSAGGFNGAGPLWLKLVRSGSTFTAYSSADGATWTPFAASGVALPKTLYVGLAVTSHNTAARNVAVFDNVAVTGATGAAPLPAPSQLTVTQTTAGSVTLTWLDNATDEDGYVLERSTDPAFGSVTAIALPQNSTSITDAGLADGTTYYYRLRATRGGTQSDNAGPVAATTLLPAPTALAATNVASAEIDLQWTDHSTNESGFVVEESTDGGNTFNPIVTTAKGATAYAVTGLAPSTRYAFRVKAVNAATQSAYSNTTTATTPAVAAPLTDGDVGAAGKAGGSTAGAGGTLTVSGAGTDIYAGPDAFHFTYQQVTGDATIIARLVSQSAADPYAKAGIMFRTSLDPSSPMVDLVLQANGTLLQSRRVTYLGGSAAGGFAGGPLWLKLVRSGSTFSAYTSADGATWKQFAVSGVALPQALYVGLAVTSHNPGVLNAAVFDNVSIT